MKHFLLFALVLIPLVSSGQFEVVKGKVDTILVDDMSRIQMKGGVEYLPTVSDILSYFAMPQTGISMIVDKADTIFGDELVNIPIINDLSITYQCDIGHTDGNNYVIDPEPLDVGSHRMIIISKNKGRLMSKDTVYVTVYNKAPSKSVKILLIGDSTLFPDSLCANIVREVPNVSFDFVGTVGTTYKNEGYGGSYWLGFITGGYGHFYDGTRLNLPAYFQNYSIDTPDYVYIRLGINDTFGQCDTANDGLSQAEINAILGTSQILVDSFLLLNDNLKIIIGIPTISENSGYGWAANYDELRRIQDWYIEGIHKYWISLIEKYNNAAYNDRVTCSFEAINLDRDNGYSKTNGVHDNGVHPGLLGRKQLGYGAANYFNRELRFNPYADSLFNRMAVQPPDSIKDFVSTVIDTLVHYDIWDSLNVIQCYALNTEANALLNWKSNNYNATKIYTPTFTAYEGFTGNASNWVINTGYNPYDNGTGNKFNESLSVYIRSLGIAAVSVGARESSGSDMSQISINASTGGAYVLSVFNGASNYLNNYGYVLGLHTSVLQNHTGTQKLDQFVNGARRANTTVTVSADRPDLNYWVLALNYNNTATYHNNNQISWFMAGRSLSTLQEEKKAMIIEWYMDKMGKGVIQ